MRIEGIEEFELWVESPVLLVADFGEAVSVALKGATPLHSSEAHQALREGKKIEQTAFRIIMRNQTYTFNFRASRLALSGLKIPVPPNASPADYAFLRLEIFEEFEAFFQQLFQEFLKRRLDEKAWTRERGHIAKWVKSFGE